MNCETVPSCCIGLSAKSSKFTLNWSLKHDEEKIWKIKKSFTKLQWDFYSSKIPLFCCFAARCKTWTGLVGWTGWTGLVNWTDGLMDWTGGLDWWTGLIDWWTGLVDWTGGLDWWTGLVDWTGELDWWTGGLDWWAGLVGWTEIFLIFLLLNFINQQ